MGMSPRRHRIAQARDQAARETHVMRWYMSLPPPAPVQIRACLTRRVIEGLRRLLTAGFGMPPFVFGAGSEGGICQRFSPECNVRWPCFEGEPVDHIGVQLVVLEVVVCELFGHRRNVVHAEPKTNSIIRPITSTFAVTHRSVSTVPMIGSKGR